MAKKRGLLGTLTMLGAAAAATAAVYHRREEIRNLLKDAKERFGGCGDPDEDETEDWEEDDDFVIDITVEREPKKNEEDGGEN